MANQLTNYGRKLMKTGDGEPSGRLDWIEDDIRVVLVDASKYAFDVTHQYLAEIPLNARVAITTSLIGKSVSNIGAASAANVVVPTLTGNPIGALAFIKWYEEDSEQSPFFLWLDEYNGLPAYPTGGKFKIVWPTTSNKIFR